MFKVGTFIKHEKSTDVIYKILHAWPICKTSMPPINGTELTWTCWNWNYGQPFDMGIMQSFFIKDEDAHKWSVVKVPNNKKLLREAH